ncbi:hypothetical protein QJS10_CPA03g01065 [Acorus calamus]|uniref:Trichome birefringence-like N-terminal domain-containing protein n=1 Tax=Acorus calamus TaxID=4465 RepID=A0AAV9F8E7_ACOCL|nr:hypothetical protein QJS10_CPA03g01065 [Acorus calamus]
MGKRPHHLLLLLPTLRPCSLRTQFITFVALLVVFVVVIAASLFGEGVPGGGGDSGGGPKVAEGGSDGDRGCDWSSGRWVRDNSTYPLYAEGGCAFMSDQLACGKFGRRDTAYQNWRWQPHGCDLPRFNATAMLEKLRNKRVVFVGDSLNRNQWVSMVCLLESKIQPSQKYMQTNGSLIAFHAKEYNASVEFYWSPLLVESNSDDPVNHRLPDRIVRARSIEKHARHWTGADVLVFNSYLWWKRPKMKVLWGSFGGEDGVYKEVEMLRSYKMALETWSNWLEFQVDPLKTNLFFMSMSPTHFWGDEWGARSDQNCYNETEPIKKEAYWGRGSNATMMGAVEEVIGRLEGKGVTVRMINVTQLSEYRKDGHPSIYRKQWEPLSEAQIADPKSYADCIHWCLPGVPDVWNELLYAYMFSR